MSKIDVTIITVILVLFIRKEGKWGDSHVKSYLTCVEIFHLGGGGTSTFTGGVSNGCDASDCEAEK